MDGTRPRHLDGPSLRRVPSVGDPLCGYGSYDDEGAEEEEDDDEDDEDDEEDDEDGDDDDDDV